MATAKAQYGVLENVVLAYAKIAEPTTKYQSKDLEYVVDCIVDKATAKAWNKSFPKQKAKELEADEFQEKYKMDNPFGGDEVYIIKMKKAASKDGEMYDEKFRPRVLLDTADGERVDITTSRLISNGSKAKVSYRITENSFGIFGQLNNILMDEDGFIEYVSKGGGAGSEFDGKRVTKAEGENTAATQARANKAAQEDQEEAPKVKAAKPSKPKAPVVDDDIDGEDDIPF